MSYKRSFGKMAGTALVGLSIALASAVPAQATEIPTSRLSHNQVAGQSQTVTYSDGTTVTDVMADDGKNVQLYLNGAAPANGLLWTAAGLTAGTGNLPAAAVAGVAGVVTSGIIGIAGAEC